MKKIALIALLVAAPLLAHDDHVVKKGAAIAPDATPTAFADVMAKPEAHTEKAVVIEGVVEKVCAKMGCWMQIAPEEGKAGLRVAFDDFTISPKSKGMKARAEGVTKVKVLTKAEADHLEEDGAKLVRNADGTAKEVSFVAKGVELTRQK